MIFGLSAKDVIDILLVATLLFQTYRLMRGTGALKIFVGIIAFLVVWFFVEHVLKMELLGSIFSKFIDVGVIGLVVIFQSEIRRFFMNLGVKNEFSLIRKMRKRFSPEKKTDENMIMPMVLACQNMAKKKTGALIIIERKVMLREQIETGEKFSAEVNAQLIETIFFKNSPLHDGALIISDGKIVAGRCILPISKNLKIPPKFGLRHRSAIGMTETTDALAIVVSEETGKISLIKHGQWGKTLSAEELKISLLAELNEP